LGFQSCPDQRPWLEEAVARLENNSRFRYEIKDPQRSSEGPPVFSYVKLRHRAGDSEPVAEQEVLFRLKRPAGPLVITVKPTALAPGLATRLIAAVATGPWDAQPDDLQRLEIPADLKDTNILAALGPSGTELYGLVDSATISVALGLGDAGGLFVRFRDGWCSVASASSQIPFKVDEVVARIQPLL
jgi:hypothetical protein